MIKRPTFLVWLCLAATLGATSTAADAPIQPLAPAGAPARDFPSPDRPVAEIVSPIWATEEQRDKVDEAGQLARHLGVRPGETVADIGAGSGYHTVRFAKRVGPTGRVLAQDVMPDYLAGLDRRVREEGLANVTLGLGEGHDPRLPPASVDVALLVHMYHEIAQPFAFLHNLVPALKPGAKVGVVDLDRATWLHGTPRDLLACEFAAVGFRQVAFHTLSGDIGYLAVFEGPREGERKRPSEIVPCKLQKP
jgi:SAM-dependent methyltransferase